MGDPDGRPAGAEKVGSARGMAAESSTRSDGSLAADARELARPEASRALRSEFMRTHAEAVYQQLTDDYSREIRVEKLVFEAARQFPGLVPTPEQIAAERGLRQSQKQGAELDQGIFLAHILARPRPGTHLCHVMLRPRPEAVDLLESFRLSGHADLGLATVERREGAGHVNLRNLRFLNAEDDGATAALEIGVDLVLLDPGCEVGVLRGAVVDHPRHRGRRVFNAGINLTHLYHGQISLVDFMMAREMGLLGKILRGHWRSQDWESGLEDFDEKPWIAAVESFAIGGGCQLLLVMDRVIAERGAYFNLPARKEGIIPGAANLRLPRFVGDRVARQAIMFERAFATDHPDAAMLCDRVVTAEDMDAAIAEDAEQLVSAGPISASANRKAIRISQEPLDRFRRYMAMYAREQSRCMYAPALIRNLEENWQAQQRRL